MNCIEIFNYKQNETIEILLYSHEEFTYNDDMKLFKKYIINQDL